MELQSGDDFVSFIFSTIPREKGKIGVGRLLLPHGRDDDELKTSYVTRLLIPVLECTNGDHLRHDDFFHALNAIPAE